ncbi:MAG: PEP-CTERM sorting domain-containing protein [Lentisphaeria bacterium]|nr:PEP-CTERM sorting domain-containing protein [Lentisphaeria bacterium]
MRVSLILFVLVCPFFAFAGLTNGGFENDEGWTFFSNSDITGTYVESWSSEGVRSYQFYRNTGSSSSNYLGQITQAVDLTFATGIIFDCQDIGIDGLLLQFLVDDQLVDEYTNNGHNDGGTSWGSTAENLDIGIQFNQQYAGTHDLTIRMQEISNYSPADPKIYRIDNVRLVLAPEPTSLALLALGIASLKNRGRSRK